MSRPRRTQYLTGYPPALVAEVQHLIDENRLGPALRRRYPALHTVRSDRALYDYVGTLKTEYLRSTPPLSHVSYDNSLHVIRNALGLHTSIARVQGNKLKAKREIRIATLFREAPEAFLRMIVVHELAHLRVSEHDRAFYQLCCHMEPDYHQLEFDLRAWLTLREAGGVSPWADGETPLSPGT
ncbi:M48 metallopeptidase family protein [Uliginosibacterium sp. H1]|uniref:M48 metallopeptidase family protein n=1 Tax=Uliginosibacterium sp. H1 TaxID=3114757 RepID=UPI002E194153|nr:YgjP-like metallopeptidase domain-containing protein [Uliginosibacterium sp. H1]